jgi:biotin operon repressor
MTEMSVIVRSKKAQKIDQMDRFIAELQVKLSWQEAESTRLKESAEDVTKKVESLKETVKELSRRVMELTYSVPSATTWKPTTTGAYVWTPGSGHMSTDWETLPKSLPKPPRDSDAGEATAPEAVKLSAKQAHMLKLMKNGDWFSKDVLAKKMKSTPESVSTYMYTLKKQENGGHVFDKRRSGPRSYEYRLVGPKSTTATSTPQDSSAKKGKKR